MIDSRNFLVWDAGGLAEIEMMKVFNIKLEEKEDGLLIKLKLFMRLFSKWLDRKKMGLKPCLSARFKDRKKTIIFICCFLF